MFKRIDAWLCRKLPSPVRLWWCRLWIRKDEFHPSLDTDPKEWIKNPEKYQKDLDDRRQIAHDRDCPPGPYIPGDRSLFYDSEPDCC